MPVFVDVLLGERLVFSYPIGAVVIEAELSPLSEAQLGRQCIGYAVDDGLLSQEQADAATWLMRGEG